MKERLRAAVRFAAKHLAISALIAAASAVLVFGLWYPHPYSVIASGRELFALVISVDVVAGPLLSLIVYNPAKPRRELFRDIGAIALLQITALVYGLYSVAQARPVYLAFEGDRFRVVAVPDIETGRTERSLSWTGPRLIGVKLLDSSDPEVLRSIQLSIQGVHPAYRPERWVDYDSQRAQVIKEAKSLAVLKRRRPSDAGKIDEAVRDTKMPEDALGYLPLHSEHRSDWIVVVSLEDAKPVTFLPVDGWY